MWEKMFSSNQLFEVTGDDDATLKAVLNLAVPRMGWLKSYRIAAGATLVFGTEPGGMKGYIGYPMEVTLDIAVRLVLEHLQSATALETYKKLQRLDEEMDGMCRKGWRVFYPGWRGYNDGYNDIDNDAGSPDPLALIAVAPFWTFYHI